jgi:hypothetical protein
MERVERGLRAQAASAAPPPAQPPAAESSELPVSDDEQKLRDDGYTDEGIAKLREFMRQHGVTDARVAAVAYEQLNPPPPPVETGGSAWNFFAQPPVTAENTGLDLLLQGDDEGFLRVSVPLAIKEARGQ